MAISTYSELKTAIADWTARDDLTSYIDNFIDLAETYLKRAPSLPRLPEIGGVRGNITRLSGSLSTSANTLDLPADYLDSYRLTLTSNGVTGVMRYVDPTQLSIYQRDAAGLPRWYTISDKIEFDRTPDSTYAYELSYFPKVTALSASNTTNWILTDYPDVYLAAALFHAFRFTQDDATSKDWLDQYKVAAWSASETYRQGRVNQGPISVKTDSINP